MPTYITLGSRALRRGDEGTDVELLQNFLKILPDPIGSAIKEKGVFGRETENAVKKFQKYFNLTIDGVVGAKTFLFLGVPTANYLPPGGNLFGARILKKGNFGFDVWVLQNRLATTAKKFAKTLGQPANSNFGSKTEATVRLFQNDVNVVSDGIVGPETVFQLYNYATMGARVLQEGRWERNQGYDVYWLQRDLQELGYYQGKQDGKFGPLTKAAVKKLQEASGIKADGIVGAATFYHLASS